MRDRQLLLFAYKLCISTGLSVTLSFASFLQAKAQLIPDNTLGKENSIVNSSKLLQRIDGGAIRDSNLFHSFKEFNIDSGKSVYFSNPGAIENILTRVTGKNPSNIFGKLGVLGNANLFLLNPNGIIFGKGASLDIPGSFTATTSPSILFDNGFEFSTTNPSSVPLLKVNITPGLQYPRSQQGDISNQGNLTVGKDLNISGKNLDLNGSLNSGRDLNLKAKDSLQIRDNFNNPFIINAGRDLLLQANQTIDIFALNHPDSGLFSGNDLILRSSKPVLGDARYFSGGNFRIEQLDGNLGDLKSPNDPIIRASGDVRFDSYKGASLHILAGGSVNINGDVTITGADGENGLQETVTLSNGESLEIDGKRKATLDIRAGTAAFGTPGITGSGDFAPVNPNTGGSGSSNDIVIGGNIQVDGVDGLVYLTNLYNLNNSLNQGDIQLAGDIDINGGSIIIEASGDIQSVSSSCCSTITSEGADINLSSIQGGILAPLLYSSGSNSGDITITAKADVDVGRIETGDFSNSENSGKVTITSSNGNIYLGKLRTEALSKTGDINISAFGDINISNSIFSSSTSQGSGNINITSTGGSINSTVSIDSLTEFGNSGSINLTADKNIKTNDIDSSVIVKGNAGAITLKAGGDISTGSLGSYSDEGNGGTVKLEAKNGINNVDSIITYGTQKSGDIYLTSLIEPITLTDSFISANADINGNAGDINLQAPSIELNQTDITSTAPGSGNSGNILLNSTNLTYFDNSRLLTALEPGSSGEGGNIEIDAQKLQLENYSLIDTGTYSKGDAGNVNVSAQEIYLNNGSSILSLTSGRGNAGDINLEITDKVSLTNQSKIATAAIYSTGNSGNIDITSNSFFLSSGSQLLALTQGGGSSGDINLNVNEIVDIRGIGADGSLSGIFTSSESLNSGTGGDITIETSDLNIINGGVLSAQTFSQSDGGNITVNANNVSLQNGGQMLTNTFETGSAGEIAINATGNVNIAGIDSEFESRPTPIKVAEQEFSTDLYSCKFGNCSQTLSEQEPNNSLETAQKITEEQFSLNSLKNTNENVEFSTRIPYVSIGATVDNSVDYYAVEVKQAGTRAVFDLDYEGVDLDAKLTLFNNQGDELAANNNASDNLGAGGSQSFIGGLDPYLRYTFTKPGTYFIKVNQADGSGIPSFFSSLDYGLQISLETPPLTASTVNSGAASGIFARTEGIGTAGNIEINTPQFNITDAAQLTVSSKSNSSAGDLLVDAKIVNINNQAKISAETESGISGNVQFNNLESLQLNQNSQITASTVDGEAGDIIINSSDFINIFDASSITSEAKGEGIAGELDITTKKFNINNASRASVNSKKAAGDLTVTADSIILDNQAKLTSETDDGISGDIKLENLQTLQLSGDSLISATTKDGEAGDIIIDAALVKIETDSKIASGAVGNGEAGFIDVTTNKLTISENSQATVSSKGSGNAGYVEIKASDINLDNQAKIFATTETGISGDITLKDVNSLFLNNSQISASTVDGEAGNININATDSIKIDSNSKLESAATGKGEAGFIEITTNKLTISDNSQATVSSKGSGNAGYILIEANNVNLDNQAKISANTQLGISGDITLKDVNSLFLNNSEISASTVDGEAGNLNINSANSVELTGKGGLSVQANEDGIAGSITVNASDFSVKNEAQVSVSSKLGQAGNLDIAADKLFLNRGILTAETSKSGDLESANITLSVNDLLIISNNSLISAEAFDTANGGNITINNSQGFTIGLPFENSDITANADKGNGGDINITTQNIFGLVFREQRTSKSDITASSKFGLNGEVTINQLNIDPASVLGELPSTLVETTRVKAGCTASNGNSFIISGKGGLPTNPEDLFNGQTSITNLVDLVPKQEYSSNIKNENSNISLKNPKNKIVEATGWIVDNQGSVIFVAQIPKDDLQNSVVPSVDCKSFEENSL